MNPAPFFNSNASGFILSFLEKHMVNFKNRIANSLKGAG